MCNMCMGSGWRRSYKRNGAHLVTCVFHHRSCPSSFHKKKKRGSKARGRTEKQKSTKGPETMGHTYELVSELPRSGEGNQGPQSEDSSLHYADIQVCSRTQPRSAQEVKHLQIENATEYATIRFPQATPHYDSKNGTLV
uniref:Chromosome 11 open reading frame 52 n=1 Tax=Monodelphis domestica TaxID=13616 RepID=A0A5F8G9Y6_MONDO